VELTDDDTITADKTAVESAYRLWCRENDIDFDESKFKNWFWRSINDIMPRMRDKGRSKGRGENRVYNGIALKTTSNGAA
jgi:hypothetical protein